MQKAALKTVAGTAALLMVVAVVLALFATISNDEAAAHLDRISAHKLSGVAPGQIYQFVDGEPRGAPVCRLQDLSGILVRDSKGDIEFRNSLGRLLPFVANLYGSLGSQKSTLEGEWVSDGFHTIRWRNVVDLYIPAEDLQGRIVINPKCETTVESIASAGGTVCIIQRVMHHASSKSIVYAYDWRQDCIGYCPETGCENGDGSPTVLAPPISIWSRVKFELGLITSEIIIVEPAGEDVAALEVN